MAKRKGKTGKEVKDTKGKATKKRRKPRKSRGVRYDEEFKAKALGAVKRAQETQRQSITDIARKLGVTHQTLYKWVRQSLGH